MKPGPEEPISDPGDQIWESCASLGAFPKTSEEACLWATANAQQHKKEVIYFPVQIVENFLP